MLQSNEVRNRGLDRLEKKEGRDIRFILTSFEFLTLVGIQMIEMSVRASEGNPWLGIRLGDISMYRLVTVTSFVDFTYHIESKKGKNGESKPEDQNVMGGGVEETGEGKLDAVNVGKR